MSRLLLILTAAIGLTATGCNSDDDNGGLLLTITTQSGSTYRAVSGDLNNVEVNSDSLNTGVATRLSTDQENSSDETRLRYDYDFTQPALTLSGYTSLGEVLGVFPDFTNLLLVNVLTNDTTIVRTRPGDYIFFDEAIQIREDNLTPVTLTLVPENIFVVNGQQFFDLSDSRVEVTR